VNCQLQSLIINAASNETGIIHIFAGSYVVGCYSADTGFSLLREEFALCQPDKRGFTGYVLRTKKLLFRLYRQNGNGQFSIASTRSDYRNTIASESRFILTMR
jgi:hypothetical protein